MTKVMIGIPNYNRYCELEMALYTLLNASRRPEIMYSRPGDGAGWIKPASGGFTHTELWCEFLNHRKHGLTHGAVVHTDIQTLQPWWLDTYLDMMQCYEAEILFGCVPLKDDSGYYNCAIKAHDQPMSDLRRLSIKDVDALPPAFCASDIDRTGRSGLIMGGGLMLFDLRRPWVESCDFICHGGKIQEPETGDWKPWFASEDYIESTRLSMMGVRIYGTKTVRIKHWGRAASDSEGSEKGKVKT